ncbi:MAG: hypothetical protein P8J32_02530, partial [bacterium]|nr:hypothetical protein [bacterium]
MTKPYDADNVARSDCDTEPASQYIEHRHEDTSSCVAQCPPWVMAQIFSCSPFAWRAIESDS